MNTKHCWYLAGLLALIGSDVGCGSDKSIYDNLGSNVRGGDGGVRRDGGSKGNGSDDDVCGKHAVQSDRAIPDMLIVLDRSASMSPAGNDRRTDRWRGSATAVQQLTQNYSGGINFGLMTFPGGGQSQNVLSGLFGEASCTAGEVDVEIGPGNGPAINQAIARMFPGGFTPTAATLEAAIEIIGSPEYSDQEETAAKYVLLVTDGDPNCSEDFLNNLSGGIQGGGLSVEDPKARTESIDAIKKLTKAGVLTFVVGYETAGTNFEEQLDMMAAAGGTGEKKHRSVESAADLAATFDELAEFATSCSYRLSEEVDPTYVYVTVGDEMRDYNKPDGWRLESDNRTVSLVGKACDDAKEGGVFEVEVQCNPVIGF